ncbi:hypothetical protein PRUPE_2G069400 [Prunus persica]|uniref:Uncharacterized protein n=1 Tax=Prunus persica TaxID=3760 RepID=A0A251QCF2_PRUPE|nr:hypothetical protein PRUPE_2G069400 [Prunus persica]
MKLSSIYLRNFSLEFVLFIFASVCNRKILLFHRTLEKYFYLYYTLKREHCIHCVFCPCIAVILSSDCSLIAAILLFSPMYWQL